MRICDRCRTESGLILEYEISGKTDKGMALADSVSFRSVETCRGCAEQLHREISSLLYNFTHPPKKSGDK